MKEEDWLKQVIEQMDHLPQASMRDGFLQELQKRTQIQKVSGVFITKRRAWLAAASFALLMVANILAVNKATQQSSLNKYEEMANTFGLAEENQPFNLDYNE